MNFTFFTSKNTIANRGVVDILSIMSNPLEHILNPVQENKSQDDTLIPASYETFEGQRSPLAGNVPADMYYGANVLLEMGYPLNTWDEYAGAGPQNSNYLQSSLSNALV